MKERNFYTVRNRLIEGFIRCVLGWTGSLAYRIRYQYPPGELSRSLLQEAPVLAMTMWSVYSHSPFVGILLALLVSCGNCKHGYPTHLFLGDHARSKVVLEFVYDSLI